MTVPGTVLASTGLKVLPQMRFRLLGSDVEGIITYVRGHEVVCGKKDETRQFFHLLPRRSGVLQRVILASDGSDTAPFVAVESNSSNGSGEVKEEELYWIVQKPVDGWKEDEEGSCPI